jgi:hypothetical protein
MLSIGSYSVRILFCFPPIHSRVPDTLLQREHDNKISVAMIDTSTHYGFEGVDKTSQTSMQDLVRHPSRSLLISSFYLYRRGQFDTYNP